MGKDPSENKRVQNSGCGVNECPVEERSIAFACVFVCSVDCEHDVTLHGNHPKEVDDRAIEPDAKDHVGSN